MAVTANEILMVFRGQNYLSGAIRRVSRDVGGLSRGAQLSQQRTMLSLQASRLKQSNSIAQSEIYSIKQGSRRLALDQARVKLNASDYNNVTRLRKAEEARIANSVAIKQNMTQIAQLERVAATGRPVGRGLSRMMPADVQRNLAAAKEAQQRLFSQTVTLNRAFEAQQGVINNSGLAAQQLAAREIQLVQREAQLQQAIQNRTRLIEENTLAQQRNNYEATKIAPVEMWNRRASAIEHAGRVMQMFGLITVAALGYAAESAAKFSSQFTLAATQARPPGAGAGATAGIAANIQKNVLSMMQKFPATASDMANSFYEIFSGTNIQSVSRATDAVRVFNQMAVAGGTDLKTMTDAGISLYNNFGGLHGEFKNMTQAGNAFFATVRYGRMNAQQWAAAMPNVIAIAKLAGLTYKDVSGTMAQLTRQTGAKFTSRDAQGLGRLIQLFGRADVTAGLASKGIPVFNAGGKMRAPLDIIQQIHDKLHLTNQEALNFFKSISALGSGKGGTQGTIQAVRAFGYLYETIKAAQKVAKQTNQDTDELSKSFLAMSKTPGVKWEVFKNQLRVLVYEIGTQAIPAFVKLSKPILSLIHGFNDLSDNTKHWIAIAGTFAGAGALMLGTIMAVAGGVGKLVLGFTLMRRMKVLSSMITPAEALVGAKAASNVINPATGGVFSALAAEGGGGSVAAVAGLGITAGITSALPVLILFHKQIGQIIGDVAGSLGGIQKWAHALGAIAIAMTAIKFGKMIASMQILDGEIIAETGLLTALRASILGLAGLAAVATVLVIERHKIVKDAKDYFNTQHSPFLAGGWNPANWPYEVGKLFGGGKGLQPFANQNQLFKMAQSPRNVMNQMWSRFMKAARNAKNAPGSILGSGAVPTIPLPRIVTPNEWIAKIEKARAAMIGSPGDVNKARKYEAVLEAMNKAFKSQPDLLAAINDVLGNYNTALGKGTQLGITFQDTLAGVQNLFNNFKQQEDTVMGTLFSGPFMNSPFMQGNLQWGGRISGQNLVRDAQSQITLFRSFHGELDKLTKRGAPFKFTQELLAMGPGDPNSPDSPINKIKALTRLSAPELKRYFELIRTQQRLVQQQTMKDLNAQLAQYRQHGRDIALAIIAGLRDENVAVTTALTKMIKNMFPGLPVGATGAGDKPTHRPTPAHPAVNNNTTIHVTAPHSDTSLKSQIRHAEMALRNRRGGRVGGRI